MRLPRPLAFLFFALVAFLWTVAADAYTPPRLNGHVVDTAGALSRDEVLRLDQKLDRARRGSGFHIVVLLLPKVPDGETIEDVGYGAGNTWGVGSKEGDEGVIVIATIQDRKLRIETGRGVGGALTDVQAHHINTDVIGPLMKQGQVYQAMDRGTDAIIRELVAGTPGGTSETGRDPKAARRGSRETTKQDIVKMAVGGAVLLLVLILAIVSPTFRSILFWILLFGRGGGGGGGSSGGGGGSGYGGGGGGSFGGGGSSDDY